MTQPADTDPDLSHEEVETIPWAMLADQMEHRRIGSYLRYALAAIGFFVIVFLGLGPLRSSPGTVVDLDGTLPPADVPAGPATTAAPVEVTNGGEASSSTVHQGRPAPVLYSEADLMAVLPETLAVYDERQVLAAHAAESFVRDYFTTDDPVGSGSWVEWATTAQINTADDGSLLVTIGFQTLLAHGGGDFGREPPRAVVVPVRSEGETAIVTGRPRPASFSHLVQVDLPAPTADVVPDDVARRAEQAATETGEVVQVLGGTLRTDGSWEVAVEIAAGADLSWIYTVVVEP